MCSFSPRRMEPLLWVVLSCWIWGSVILLTGLSVSGSVQRWTFGGAGTSWQDGGIMEALETTSRIDAVRPEFTPAPVENLAATARRGPRRAASIHRFPP